MSDELKDLQAKVSILEKRLSWYEQDSTVRGFYALNKIVNQQIDILNDFNLKFEIIQNPKEDKKYDRVEGIWTKINTMITNLNQLKLDLRITGDEEKDKKKLGFIESLAEKRL